jgi:hypothetical protein
MLYIDNRKKSAATLKKLYPNAKIVDVTSKATDFYMQFSPFYPHGDIPVPFSEGKTAASVEGIWQGLKVFETADIDTKTFQNTTMRNIKRTVRTFGKPLGHRKGVNGSELLGYIDARVQIYLPAYLWVLEHKLQHLVAHLRQANETQDLVLLDYETNCDVLNAAKPLSHAFLVKAYLENAYPTATNLVNIQDLPNLKSEKTDAQLLLF